MSNEKSIGGMIQEIMDWQAGKCFDRSVTIEIWNKEMSRIELGYGLYRTEFKAEISETFRETLMSALRWIKKNEEEKNHE